MKRCLAALLAAIVVSGPLIAAAGPAGTRFETVPLPRARPPLEVALEPTGAPFETLPLPEVKPRPHRVAYASMLVGAGLIGASYALSHHADETYDRYLRAESPAEIDRLFGETTRYDRWSSAALLSGEALIATGLYLRFLRRPVPETALRIGPSACAVSFRF